MKVFNIKCLALKAHVNMILHILTEYIFLYFYVCIFIYTYIREYVYIHIYVCNNN